MTEFDWRTWRRIDQVPPRYVSSDLPAIVVAENARRPFGVFVSDDGTLADLERLAPVAHDKKLPFVLAVTRDNVGRRGYMNVGQLREMSDLGCEVVGHGARHIKLASLRDDDARREVTDGISWLRDQGWSARHFVYPYGSHRVAAERAVAELCDSACLVTGGMAVPPFMRTRLPRHALGSFFQAGVKTFEGYRQLVDQAIERRALLIWMLHPWSEEHDAIQQAILLDLIDYMRSAGMEIGTMSEGWTIHRNQWESTVSGRNNTNTDEIMTRSY